MSGRLAVFFWLLGVGFGWAQGFAGLGTEAEGFAVPERGAVLSFPADHGPHPDYRIEWWYVTANLVGEDGRDYGVQWTLFRSALAPGEAPGWESPQVWMGHAAVTTPDQHFVAERFSRGGIGQAGVTAQPFEAWIDDWAMRGPSFDRVEMTARGDDFGYALSLAAEGPLVFQGDQGYSVKSREGQASYYYSQPFYQVRGVVDLPSGPMAVTGAAWLDREWSSQPLSDAQTGWDWVSLSFEDGQKLMGFRLRQAGGADFHSGTLIAADGSARALAPEELVLTPLATHEVAGREVPVEFRVQVPGAGIDVQIEAINRDAWMATSFPYWEGPVRISGSHAGRGYLEMTGYGPE